MKNKILEKNSNQPDKSHLSILVIAMGLGARQYIIIDNPK